MDRASSFFSLLVLASVLGMLVAVCVASLGALERLQSGFIRLLSPASVSINLMTRRNLARYARRNGSTHLIFGTVVGMLVLSTTFLAAIQASSLDTVRMGVGADVRVEPAGGIAESELATLDMLEGVEAAAAVTSPSRVRLETLAGNRWADAQLFGASPGLGLALHSDRIRVSTGPLPVGQAPGPEVLSNLGIGQVALSAALASELGVAPGAQISLRSAGQRFYLEVVASVSSLPGLPGVFSNNDRVGDGALVSLATMGAVTGGPRPFSIAFLKLGPESSHLEVSRLARAALVSHLAVRVTTTEEALEALRDDAAFVQGALDHVFSMLTTVAVFSLVTGLYASVLERDFEIGVLKVLGLRKRNIAASLMLEGAAIAFVAVTVGVGAGLAVGFGLVWWLNLFSPLQLEVAIPLVAIGLVYASTLSSSLVSTWFTARWSAKREAVDQMARRQ